MRDYAILLAEMWAANGAGEVKKFIEGLSDEERSLLEEKFFNPMIEAVAKIVESPEFQQLICIQQKIENAKWN